MHEIITDKPAPALRKNTQHSANYWRWLFNSMPEGSCVTINKYEASNVRVNFARWRQMDESNSAFVIRMQTDENDPTKMIAWKLRAPLPAEKAA